MKAIKSAKDIEKTTGPLVVRVYAVWCGACKGYSRAFDQVARAWSGQACDFARCNAEAGDLCESEGITSVPMTLIVQNGKVTHRLSGAVVAPRLKAWIEARI